MVFLWTMTKLKMHCILPKLEKLVVMALKIRCSECRKKMSVDEAFAGSIYRCPYCKSIVRVPVTAVPGQVGLSQTRPSRPGGCSGRPILHRAKSPGGSGLEDVTGSRAVVFAEHPANRKHPAGPTKIDKTNIPQIHHHQQRPVFPADAQIGATFKSEEKPPVSGGKPFQPERPAPSESPPDALSAPGNASVRTVRKEPSASKKVKKLPMTSPGWYKGAIETISVDKGKLSAEQLGAIPTANPVILQGTVTLVLIIVLLIVAAASIFLGIMMFSRGTGLLSNGGTIWL